LAFGSQRDKSQEDAANYRMQTHQTFFSRKGVDMGRIPVELVATIIEKFSFKGQSVLDLTNAIGKSHCSGGTLKCLGFQII